LLRRLSLVVGVLAVVAIAWYVANKYKPQWFDTEFVDPAQLETLQSAELRTREAPHPDFGWPGWFGPNRDGLAPHKPIRTDWDKDPPTKVWEAPCGGGYASLAVAHGRVYTTDYSGGRERVLCLDAETGKELWHQSWDVDYTGVGYAAGPRATPTVSNGQVFVLGATGHLVCLGKPNLPGGMAVEQPQPAPLPPPPPVNPEAHGVAHAMPAPANEWKHDLRSEFDASVPTWGFASSPLVHWGMVIVQAGGQKGSVVAFWQNTGELAWAAGSDPNGYSSPVAAGCAGVPQVIAVTGESILGVHGADGRVLWQYPWATENKGNIATPVVVGDYVFVSSGYGKGCVLLHLTRDGEDGVKAKAVYFRKGRVMQNHHSTCVYKDGFLYGYDNDVLRCVDLRKGEVIEDWNAREVSGNRNKGCVILAGDHLIGLTQTGTVFLADADPTEFRLRGKVDDVLSGSDCWALPVLVDGRLYLRDHKKVVCLDVRPK
jgi:outer membrane protein assembly factor BamB